MSENPNNKASQHHKNLPSVHELEENIRANPQDADLKEELARALIDRYLGGDEDNMFGNEIDIKRVREIVAELSDSRAYYPRAYLAYLDEKDNEAVYWLEKYANGGGPVNPGEPFNANKLYLDIVEPFTGASKAFWSGLAESMGKLWPESPAALTLAGYAKHDDEKLEEAFDYYESALKIDRDYWLAAWEIGVIHHFRKNWQAASQYYERSLEAEIARLVPSIRFAAAWCAGKLGEHTNEEKHYRACLDLDPNSPGANNNLGWALYRQGRFEEALVVFDDCIARKVDGAYPRRNRAKVLTRLGRLSEAIDAWKQGGRGGKVSKYAQEQIDKLQARVNRGERGGLDVPLDEEDSEDGIVEDERKKGRRR